MNGADRQNNSENSPKQEQANCPFYLVLPQKHPETNVSEILFSETQVPEITTRALLLPARDEYYEENSFSNKSNSSEVLQQEAFIECDFEHLPSPTPEEIEEVVETKSQDWVAEPDSEQQASVGSEFQTLLALNKELTLANNELYEQVELLKNTIKESEANLQWQKKRADVTESILNEQTRELTVAQNQVKSLFEQLESALQKLQHQESLADNYKGQLQISQQRLAQLERQCALLQTNYNEQSHQLLQAENTCRELRTRLQRQQRQTLQFKAALEKCLSSPEPKSETASGVGNAYGDVDANHFSGSFSKNLLSNLTKTQPIKPWSSEHQPVVSNLNSLVNNSVDNSVDEDLDNPWIEEATTTSSSVKNHQSTESETSTQSVYIWDELENTEEVIPKPETKTPEEEVNQEITSEELIVESDEPEVPSNVDLPIFPEQHFSSQTPGSQQLEQQLEQLIQMFFTEQSKSPETTATNANNNPEVANQVWETIATPVNNDETPKPTVETPEDYWSEISPMPGFDYQRSAAPLNPLLSYTNQGNSPSPVVYPQRPAKKRKSLSSVELPNFNKMS